MAGKDHFGEWFILRRFVRQRSRTLAPLREDRHSMLCEKLLLIAL